MSTVKAIALCRVSTKKQLLDGNLEPQEERIKKAAAFLDAEILQWWRVAISSRKGKNVERKDIVEMYRFCKAHKSVSMLIIDEVDRFMRSIDEYYYWKTKVKIIGVELRFAKRPEINPNDTMAVFEELMDIFKAQQSNEERILKTPANQKARIMAGYYPSNPHTGYRKSETPGLHIPDEPNWSAMRDTFQEMARGECSISEGLKRATERGLTTKNYGPKSTGGKTIDMYRWKELMCDAYYCGVITFGNWDTRNEEGLHRKMITKAEHEILVNMVKNKGKRFIVIRNNPEFPFSNDAECLRCVLGENPYPRLVGYWQSNGEKKGFKRYRRYRCRDCNLGLRQEQLHEAVKSELELHYLTQQDIEDLKRHCRKVWGAYERTLIEKARIARGHVENLNTKKSKLIETLSLNPELGEDIKPEIEKIKVLIAEADEQARQAENFEQDYDAFIDYALSFLSNINEQIWGMDMVLFKICKQMLFPDGILILPNKKVYIPKISPIYGGLKHKSDPEGSEIMSMEGPVGLEPTTPCLKGRCSNQLSYGPVYLGIFFSRVRAVPLPTTCSWLEHGALIICVSRRAELWTRVGELM